MQASVHCRKIPHDPSHVSLLRVQKTIDQAVQILEEQFEQVELLKAEVEDLKDGKLPEKEAKPLLPFIICSQFSSLPVRNLNICYIALFLETLGCVLYTGSACSRDAGSLRLITKVENQLKATQKACAKVTTAETSGKIFGFYSLGEGCSQSSAIII